MIRADGGRSSAISVIIRNRLPSADTSGFPSAPGSAAWPHFGSVAVNARRYAFPTSETLADHPPTQPARDECRATREEEH